MDNYSLIAKGYQPTADELLILNTYPPTSSSDWTLFRYQSYKDNLKKHNLLKQLDRCAYCRRIIETDGYYEPLEHIVPKSLKPIWLLEPKNLIVVCDACNNIKNDVQTLIESFVDEVIYPENSEAFRIFHPHFDIWADHLQYEDDFFLVAVPNSKGDETVKICKLYRYHLLINRVKELKIGQQDPAKKIVHRLRNLNLNSETAKNLLDAIDHLLDRVEDATGFQKEQ